jgi:hypothetical protein
VPRSPLLPNSRRGGRKKRLIAAALVLCERAKLAAVNALKAAIFMKIV